MPGIACRPESSARPAPAAPIRRRLAAGWLVAAAIGLAGPAVAPATAQQPEAERTEGATGLGTVQPGDLIRLKVWREPDLSGDITVDPNGTATLPRMGPTPVSGMTADSLRRIIVATYARYLRDPAVDVTVLPRVTILGAVRQPGVHNVDPSMTLADVLALAGGASQEGKQDKVELRRRGERVKARLSLDSPLAETPVRSGDQIVVPERAWLSRNAGLLLGTASLGISLVYLIFR